MPKKLLLRKLPITSASLLYFVLSFLSDRIILIYILAILTGINILMMLLMRNESAETKAVFAVALHLFFFLFMFGFFELPVYSIFIFLTVNFTLYRTRVPANYGRRYFSLLILMSVFLAFTEGLLRIVTDIEASGLYSNPEYPQLNVFKNSASLKQSKVHGDLIHEGAEISEFEYRAQSFHSDRYGYLNEDECYLNPVDIIILGDSYSAVSAIKQEEIWVEILKDETKANVCNLSVSGNEPWQEFVSFFLMKDKIKTKKNGIVIWQIFEGNDFKTFYGDIREDCNYKSSDLVVLNEHLENFRKTNNFNSLLGRILKGSLSDNNSLIEFDTKAGVMHCLKSYSKMASIPIGELENTSEAEHLRMITKILAKKTEEMNLKLVVLYIPSKCSVCRIILEDENSSYRRSGFSLLTEKICKENKIQFIESGYTLFSKSREIYSDKGNFLWWLDDSHLNPEGNKVIADTLIANLKL